MSDSSQPLYRRVWRWHFFAGLFVAPVLLMLAITGALYLFHDEIEGWVYPALMRVQPSGTRIDLSTQELSVLASFPGATVERVRLPMGATSAAEWQLRTPDAAELVVFVDPYRGVILGSLAQDSRLMTVVSRLHGELMLGRVGDAIVEVTACWTFVLVVTGAYLWWPRGDHRRGIFWPRPSTSRRSLLRDLHAVPAAWNALILALLVLSGLPWSGFWGEQVSKLGTLSDFTRPTPNFVLDPPVAPSRLEVDDHHPTLGDLPWAVRKAGLPSRPPVTTLGQGRIELARVMQEARSHGIDRPGLRVIYPAGERGVFTLSFVPDQAQDQRTVHIDPRDGAVIDDVGWQQYSPLGQVAELGVQMHVGRQFGGLNRFGLLVTCLLVVVTVVTGLAAWWARRPRGQWAPPSLPVDSRIGGGVIAIAVLLAVVFPLAGASMVLVMMMDTIWQRIRLSVASVVNS